MEPCAGDWAGVPRAALGPSGRTALDWGGGKSSSCNTRWRWATWRRNVERRRPPTPALSFTSSSASNVCAKRLSPPYIWSARTPKWLSINTATGVVSGTATAGNYRVTVAVDSADGLTATREFPLAAVIVKQCPGCRV